MRVTPPPAHPIQIHLSLKGSLKGGGGGQLRGALEVLMNGLSSPIGEGGGGEVVPGRINSELLSREPNSVAILLNLLVRGG